VVLPDAVSLETGAACLLQGLTALMLSREIYHVRQGDTVLVHAAAGGVGQLLCQICNDAGATVIGTTSTPAKAEIARKAGAHHVILYTEEDVVEAVKRLTDGQMVNVVYDGVGRFTFESSLASLRRRGWLVCFGNASGKPDLFDVTRLTKGSLVLTRPTLADFVSTKQEFEQSECCVLIMHTRLLCICSDRGTV
jgi:NADPH2:quinone reductase